MNDLKAAEVIDLRLLRRKTRWLIELKIIAVVDFMARVIARLYLLISSCHS